MEARPEAAQKAKAAHIKRAAAGLAWQQRAFDSLPALVFIGHACGAVLILFEGGDVIDLHQRVSSSCRSVCFGQMNVSIGAGLHPAAALTDGYSGQNRPF